jgi:hypothetical protein
MTVPASEGAGRPVQHFGSVGLFSPKYAEEPGRFAQFQALK